MADLTVYGSVKASRTWWVGWMCAELGLEFDNESLEFLGDEIRSADYQSVNPNALIPSIRDGDFVLWESMAINLYLAKRYNGGLYPEGIQGEAKAWQWSFWAVTRVEIPLLTLRIGGQGADPNSELGQYYLKHIPFWSEEELARCRSVLEKPFDVLDDAVSSQPYLMGDSFTVADLNVACILSRLQGAGVDLNAVPQLREWLRRCWSRPGCGRGQQLLEELGG
jgi:glutathione S-transferase